VVVLIVSGAVAGRMPASKSPMPALAHLRVERHADGVEVRLHRQRDAEVADDRAHHVLAAAQAGGRRIDRFLSERAESLALERRALVAHLAAGEELLQAVVDRPREDHAAQDCAPLVHGE
jgi:hypothetical protein